MDQVASAKVLKQEVPAEYEEDQGIQSEQGKTNRGQCQKDRSWVRRVSWHFQDFGIYSVRCKPLEDFFNRRMSRPFLHFRKITLTAELRIVWGGLVRRLLQQSRR